MNIMIYFKDDKTLQGIFKNMRVARKIFREKINSNFSGDVINKGKPPKKISHISFGRKMGADVMVDPNSWISATSKEIIFKPDVSIGGYEEGSIFLVNENDDEVAYFPIDEINKIVMVNKDK